MIKQSFIKKLTLENFRSYLSLTFELNNVPVVFYGNNGAGKTNILESISFLSPSKGLRSAKLEEIINREFSILNKNSLMPINANRGWTVFSILQKADEELKLGTAYLENDPPKRLIKLDGKEITGVELAGLLSIIWLTPVQDKIFREGASVRRIFFDKLIGVIDAQHKNRVHKYEHYLKEWQNLYQEGKDNNRWFKAIEENLSGAAVSLAASRKIGIDKLSNVLNKQEGVFPAAKLSLHGEIEERLEFNSALTVEDELLAHYKKIRTEKLESNKLIGPHNTDIEAIFREKNISASFCSTGEQKALLISIILSQAKLCSEQTGFTPILLLDEVVAHLDEPKRTAFFEEILRLKYQVFMTGVDSQNFYPLKGKSNIFKVENSRVFRV